ncbi:PRD domain-containing protein [Leptotrichia sp. OH3620_COT-345]|uniref:BglG family transcription antiterminator n=1 Tax=Leptotrichia sp. OH3620_COT-345 TaxID=2491048 RepID=UPI000F646240|nr:PTS sugar transporter subunit IIA [Leptotrichia sp. OH3620_COT-345]RRD39860.1 PRD domain-containing protein [Leptotrichia sp. OH3620_COT-345]
MIKKRHFDIINFILNSGNQASIKNISELYDITDRSIRYDIDELNSFFQKKYGREIIEVANNKLDILYSEEKIREKIENIKLEEYSMSEDERVELLSYEIFLLKNHFILNYFSRKYNFSKSTLRQSLKKLNERTSNYNVSIDMDNKGYKVNGNEIDIRKYIINILRYYFKITKENSLKYVLFKKIVEEFLNVSRWKRFTKIIRDISEKTKKIVSDEAFETLEIFLSVSEIRNKKGKLIKNEVENRNFLIRTPEFREISKILKKTENIYKKDILYFTDFYLGSYSYNLEYSYFLNWIMIESMIDKFLENLSIKLQINLSRDVILRKELLNHLKPAIYRMKNKLPLTESILEDVRNTYSNLYEKTEESLKNISRFINIPFDNEETAFITIMIQRAVERNNSGHISQKEPKVLIVCGLGYSSSRFLYENINNRFQVDIIDIIPFNQLEKYDYLKKSDIVISTLDFSLEGIDVITVNAIMNEEDIIKLKNYGLVERKRKIKLSELLSSIKNISDEEKLKEKLMANFGENIYDDTKQKKNGEKSFRNLICSSSIRLNVEVGTLDELIELTGEIMVSSGLVTEEYIEELKNQVTQYGKYILITDRTILPHGQLLKNVKKTGFSIVTLKNGVEFFGNKIKIVICLASRNKDEHLQAVLELNEYLKKTEFEDELLSSKTSQEVMDYLKYLEEQEIE